MPLSAIDPPFIVNVRDKAAKKHGRRFGNYVKAVLSIVLSWGHERGRVLTNPASKIKDIRRKKGAPHANRPWSDAERFAVLAAAPPHIRVPIALGMYLGLRESDVLALPKAAARTGALVTTSKTGAEVQLVILKPLAEILASAPRHSATTIAANSFGETWTASGFRASWRKLRMKLEEGGKVEPGLTFHGLRHSVATILRRGGLEPRMIADALGQKNEGMALHYSRRADLSKTMQEVGRVFEAAEAEARAEFVKRGSKKLSNVPKIADDKPAET